MNAVITNHNVLTDSDVYAEGEGYERVMIVAGWHPNDPNRMAQIHIRIDRLPHMSFAEASVWTKNSGWEPMIRLNPDVFWFDMPGYARGGNDATKMHTARLAKTVAQALIEIASYVA